MLNALSFAILGATSLWAGIDSHRLKIPIDSKPYSWNNGGAAWFISCLLLWIVSFPYYLYRRTKFLDDRGDPREQTRKVAWIGGAAVAALLLVLAASMVNVDLETPETTLARAIGRDMQKDLDANPESRGIIVKGLVFTHRDGDDYAGDFFLEYEGRSAKQEVMATYNGLTYTYAVKVRLQKPPASPASKGK